MTADPGRAIYAIYTSPAHPPVPDHLPTLIVTPHGRPQHVLYTYIHTAFNHQNYLLTPSEGGDLCVARLFPPDEGRSSGSTSSHGPGGPARTVRCEASRGLRWHVTNTGINTPSYRVTIPSSDPNDDEEQPLFQISKTTPSAPFMTLTYYTYAGHQVPPNRITFGRVEKMWTADGQPAGTRVLITGATDAERAVWKTLGEGNSDMCEWIIVSTVLQSIDDEMRDAARKAGMPLRSGPSSVASSTMPPPSPSSARSRVHSEDPRPPRRQPSSGRLREQAQARDPSRERSGGRDRDRDRELADGMRGMSMRPSSAQPSRSSTPASQIDRRPSPAPSAHSLPSRRSAETPEPPGPSRKSSGDARERQRSAPSPAVAAARSMPPPSAPSQRSRGTNNGDAMYTPSFEVPANSRPERRSSADRPTGSTRLSVDTSGAPDHRRVPGKEPSAYQPGSRRAQASPVDGTFTGYDRLNAPVPPSPVEANGRYRIGR